jgi:hypothetical protein
MKHKFYIISFHKLRTTGIFLGGVTFSIGGLWTDLLLHAKFHPALSIDVA